MVKDRPFNDKRYSIDIEKLSRLGWKQKYNFENAIDATIGWYTKNEDWWKGKVNKEG